MKFWEIFRFEFVYQIRRPWTWLFIVVLIVLNFLMTRDRAVSDALFDQFFANSPFLIANTTVFGCLTWLMMAASVTGDAAARDVATRMYPLIYTVSVKKIEYLGGRFLSAFALNAVILLGVQIGILLGVYLPGLDPLVIGPFRLQAYFTAYAYIALPNAFVATALQFWLATSSGRAMASYFGSFILFFMGFFVASFLLFRRGLGTLLDPIGIRFIVEDIAHLWSTIEKNSRLLEMEGVVLTNRLIWIGVGFVALAITYFRFRFKHRDGKSFEFRIPRLKFPVLSFGFRKPALTTTVGNSQIPEVDSIQLETRNSKFEITPSRFEIKKTLVIAWSAFRFIATSWAGLALLGFIPLMTIPVIVDQMESNGVPLIPTTVIVINELTSPLSSELSRWVIVPALLIFFAGELIWREREARLGEMIDAMPGSEWAPFLGKFVGLSLLLITFTTLQMSAAMLAQLMMGYDKFELGLYFKSLFGLQLFEYLLFALLVLVVHVLVNQKYIGHMVATITYVFIALSSLFGVEHDLLIYGASPGWSYSEMRGFGSSLGPWLWFKLYWTGWALLLAVVARLFWVRGIEGAFKFRLQMARRRLNGGAISIASMAAVFILVLGGFIFYNTNILNQYLSTAERKERQAEYERRYQRYHDTPQPEPTHAKLNIEIYPKRREAEIRGAYSLVNRSAVPIDSIHVATVPNVATEITFDKTTSLVLSDEEHHHRIYKLKTPLSPGDSLQFNFQLDIKPLGFRENGVNASVTLNGTFLTNKNLFPLIGYQRSRELITANDRRDHALAARPLIAFLNDEEAYKDRGRGISFEVMMGTDADQVAVGPGELHRTWTDPNRDGRRYFHYSTNAIGDEWSFFSANYKLHEAQWNPPDDSSKNIKIRIYHHPKHAGHIDRLLSSIRASLNYYSKNFGPYRFDYLTVVERAGNGTGLHADAGMISHGEGFTLWDPRDDGNSHDHPYAIVAHEMAHQWTVPYANVEGAPVMSESVAWYYGMKMVEHSKGKKALRQLFNFMWQPHPYSPIFRGEPLLRGLDPYMSYRKGPFAFYTLSEYIGEDRVNLALRRLLEKHQPVAAPLATTLDLYRELNAVTPDSLNYLLHDLFEANTYWKLKTANATTTQLKTGKWQVALEVQARKVVVDRAGVKTELPMDEWIDVGVYANPDNIESKQPLYLRKHRIRSGKQTINVIVPSKPSRAGVDPNHVLNWEERSEENVRDF